jgi:parallel beta-helix repeat protein
MRSALLPLLAALLSPLDVSGATYYVRQTVGADTQDGLSAGSAWRSIARLSTAMHAGDTAYVGPGLYREQITVLNDGQPGARLVFVADTTGQHTGDPPGVVMITGAEPVDETIFTPTFTPGVYRADSPFPVLGVVEMDGSQRRYTRARETKEHLTDQLSELDVVAKLPSSHFYDEAARVLYLRTSDGQAPSMHEIEVIRRGAGISMTGIHYVTVVGFTFRHTGDAGIVFFKGSGDGIALDNTSYGSRQGIRVYGAPRTLIYRNTLFRNDNSGVYFALQSTDGQALANTAYENVKGVRWSSRSVDALAIDNTLFDNLEAGIALEDTDGGILRHNSAAHNAKAQLLVIHSAYTSEDNCFENGNAAQLTADFVFGEHYRTLGAYQQAKGQDLHSRSANCGPLPAKLDVHRLHAETTAYAERARRILSGAVEDTRPSPPASGTGGFRARLRALLGR